MSGIIGKNSSRSSGVIGTTAGGIASLAADSSPQLGGFLDAAGNYIQMEKGGDIASGSPTVIDTDGDFFAVTGTTNFSAFTVAADRHFFLEFGAVLTMTHGNGTLDLPGGANITTAASDVGEFVSTAADTVTCVNYTKRDGTAVVSSAGGDLRNFIIDGDFTQWPQGNGATAFTIGSYGPALWTSSTVHNGTTTWERSTDVPTLAESGHQSAYSFLVKCTGTDGTIAASQKFGLDHYITGSDYGHLHSQGITLSFWCKTASNNSGDDYNIMLQNSAANRSYVQTFSPTSSWTKFTFPLTADNTGTWLFTEADKGVRIRIGLAAGTDFDDGTEGSWVASDEMWASSGTAISNFLSSTSNEFYVSQFQLVLGSSAPTFLGEPIATVRGQVDYYVQELCDNTTANQYMAQGHGVNTTAAQFHPEFKPKRAVPTVTLSAAGTFTSVTGIAGIALTALAADHLTKTSMRIDCTASGAGLVGGQAQALRRDNVDTTSILIDARH